MTANLKHSHDFDITAGSEQISESRITSNPWVNGKYNSMNSIGLI